MFESKTQEIERARGHKQFTIKREWLEKLEREAPDENMEYWSLAFSFKDNDEKIYDQIAKKILTKFNKPKDFKFKYCISNPPYQLNVSNGGLNEDQSIPLYHHFFISSLSLSIVL